MFSLAKSLWRVLVQLMISSAGNSSGVSVSMVPLLRILEKECFPVLSFADSCSEVGSAVILHVLGWRQNWMCLVADCQTQVTLQILGYSLATVTLILWWSLGGRRRLLTSCDGDFGLLAPILQSKAGLWDWNIWFCNYPLFIELKILYLGLKMNSMTSPPNSQSGSSQLWTQGICICPTLVEK